MYNKECFSKKIPRLVIICSIIIAAISTYILLTNDLLTKPLAGKGSTIEDSVLIGGDFILTDQDGEKFNSEQMQDRISLIYFGFTYCPDICPTSLQKISMIVDSLDKYRIDVLPIFITVDPKRDTPEVLKQYLSHFNKKIIGLTGDETTIREVADLYKVYYEFVRGHELDGGTYMIDHTAFIYLMGKNRQYIKHFYITDTPENIIEYIRVNHKSF